VPCKTENVESANKYSTKWCTLHQCGYMKGLVPKMHAFMWTN